MKLILTGKAKEDLVKRPSFANGNLLLRKPYDCSNLLCGLCGYEKGGHLILKFLRYKLGIGRGFGKRGGVEGKDGNSGWRWGWGRSHTLPWLFLGLTFSQQNT
jgi:hypothetical protein